MVANNDNIEIRYASNNCDVDKPEAATGTSKKSKVIRLCVFVAIAVGVVAGISGGLRSNVSAAANTSAAANAFVDDKGCEETPPTLSEDVFFDKTQEEDEDFSNDNNESVRRELRGHMIRNNVMGKFKNESSKAGVSLPLEWSCLRYILYTYYHAFHFSC